MERHGIARTGSVGVTALRARGRGDQENAGCKRRNGRGDRELEVQGYVAHLRLDGDSRKWFSSGRFPEIYRGCARTGLDLLAFCLIRGGSIAQTVGIAF